MAWDLEFRSRKRMGSAAFVQIGTTCLLGGLTRYSWTFMCTKKFAVLAMGKGHLVTTNLGCFAQACQQRLETKLALQMLPQAQTKAMLQQLMLTKSA